MAILVFSSFYSIKFITMQLTCIAIDDEPLALDIIRNYVNRTSQLKLLQVFENAVSGGEYIRQNNVDLVFLDIHMPDISGLDLVRSLETKPIIIFTTAYKKFAYDGYELDAIDYLLKPISIERFQKAVNKAVEYYQYLYAPKERAEEAVFIYSEYRLVKVLLQDIEYIESLEDYIKIVQSNGDSIMTLMPLKKMMEKLPSTSFHRIHRSYIVAANKVNSILKKKVTLQSGKEIPISDSYLHFIDTWKKRN